MKRGLIVGSLLIAGGLLAGCKTTEGKLTATEQVSNSEAEYVDEIDNTEETPKRLTAREEHEKELERKKKEREERLASRTVIKSDSGHEYFAIKDYYLEIPEYRNVKEFTNYMPIYWEEQKSSFPDDKSQNSLSESWAANVVVAYINWFKEEIKELGLTEVFNEWQLAAYESMKIPSGDSEWFEKHDELVLEHDKAMTKAVEAINSLEDSK